MLKTQLSLIRQCNRHLSSFPISSLLPKHWFTSLWEEKETALVKSVDADVKVSRMVKLFRDVIPTFLQASMQRACKLKRPSLEHLFSDVFDELPTRLQQQKEELKRHLSKYGLHYPVDSYSGTMKNLPKHVTSL